MLVHRPSYLVLFCRCGAARLCHPRFIFPFVWRVFSGATPPFLAVMPLETWYVYNNLSLGLLIRVFVRLREENGTFMWYVQRNCAYLVAQLRNALLLCQSACMLRILCDGSNRGTFMYVVRVALRSALVQVFGPFPAGINHRVDASSSVLVFSWGDRGTVILSANQMARNGFGGTRPLFFSGSLRTAAAKILGASTKASHTPRPLEPHRCPLKDSTAPSVLSLPGLGRLEMRFSKVLVVASWGLVSRAGFANGGITTAVDDDCVSTDDDPDYDFELALLDDFRLLWSVAESSVSLKVRAQTQPCADFVVARQRLQYKAATGYSNRRRPVTI